MKILQKALLLLFLANINVLSGQNEFSKWYFGDAAGLDFSAAPPVLLSPVAPAVSSEGCATISDANGNLLFYTNGVTVRNSLHNVMANGNGLIADVSSTQSSMIVKQPGSTTIYYIFTTSVYDGAAYSIVDMSLAASLGSVTVKNATLYTVTCEKQVAVRHCNGKDVWVLNHEYNSNNFRSYLLNAAGLNTLPVISPVGVIINNTAPSGAAGQLKTSPDGKKILMATASFSTPYGFHLFDFDISTGMVSNPVALNTSVNSAYGAEFSADGTKAYGSSGFSGSGVHKLFQWNICATSTAVIAASQYSLDLTSAFGITTSGSLQRAIDGKIYLTRNPVSGFPNFNLAVINNPNAAGAAMNFNPAGPSFTSNAFAFGLPNYINSYTASFPTSFSSNVNCQNVTFTAPTTPSTYSVGCTLTSYAPNGYKWDFGEPASGVANTATNANTSHLYNATGTYTVSLILYNACSNDTIKQVINISTPGPSPAVSGASVICKGEKATYTVSGGTSYLWSSSNATTTTQVFTPSGTTVYTVSATTNGCPLAKAFTVSVDPCTGLSDAGFDYAQPPVKVYPNPVSDELMVESSLASRLFIFDVNGKLVLETELVIGLNKIDTRNLKTGVYTLRQGSAIGAWRGRMVKME